MNQDNSRYLLYKDYESGLNNELMSIELAVGIAYLTNRKLIYYGTVGSDKQLKPIQGGKSYYVPQTRSEIINNQKIPTVLDLLEKLPVETIDYQSFHQNIDSERLSYHHSNLRLVNAVFVPAKIESDPRKIKEFTEGREIFKDVDDDILHFQECNLGYYSRFFYTPPDPFYDVMDQIRFKKVYRELATQIAQALGNFNAIALRLSDFRTFLSQNEENYLEEILTTLRANFAQNELLLILTDESENKDFFKPILNEYKEHLFIDELIIKEYSSQFKNLPFTDEVTLGLICNMIAHDAQDFIGTPGSTFSGIIHRNWLKKQLKKGKDISKLCFKYVNKGFAGSFKDGVFLETKPGFYSWNRVDLPIHTETKSWYREWAESVVKPPVITSKKTRIKVPLSIKLSPILEKSQSVYKKTFKLNQLNLNNFSEQDKENELLLLCCYLNEKSSAKINNLLQEELNWEYFIQSGHAHAILPILYNRLRNYEFIPKYVLEQLRNYFYDNAQHNLFLTQELLKLLEIFKNNNITAIPFKGITLAVAAYSDLSMRMMGDSDIFVQKKDMLKVQELLIQDGYTLQRRKHHLTPSNYQDYLNSQYIYDEWYWKTLDKQSLFGVRVEIHWITDPKHIIFPLNPENILDNIESILVSGVNIPSLAIETLLVVLCLNYSKAHWIQLKMICDIAELIKRHQNLNWEKIMDQAIQLNRKRTILLGFSLANNLLEAPIPLNIHQIIEADTEIQSLTKQIRERILANCGRDPSLIQKTIFNIKLRESLQDKIRYVFLVLKKYALNYYLK